MPHSSLRYSSTRSPASSRAAASSSSCVLRSSNCCAADSGSLRSNSSTASMTLSAEETIASQSSAISAGASTARIALTASSSTANDPAGSVTSRFSVASVSASSAAWTSSQKPSAVSSPVGSLEESESGDSPTSPGLASDPDASESSSPPHPASSETLSASTTPARCKPRTGLSFTIAAKPARSHQCDAVPSTQVFAKCRGEPPAAQLGQCLGLDLPYPLTGHAAPPPDLFECVSLAVVEPVPEPHDGLFALAERLQNLVDVILEHQLRDELRRGLGVPVLDEIAQLVVRGLTHRSVKADRFRGEREQVYDPGRLDARLGGKLLGRRFVAELLDQPTLYPKDLVHALDDMHRHPDGPALVGEGP